MRKYLLPILLISLAWNQNITIAVFDFENNGLSDAEVRLITNRLETELEQIGDLKIVERQQINYYLDEKKLKMSGLIDDATEIGTMTGATHILIGSVGKINETYFTITAKLVNTDSGELEESANYDADNNGIVELMKYGLKSIAKDLVKIQSKRDGKIEYALKIGNIFIDDKDFNRSAFGNPLNIGISVWEDGAIIDRINLGKVRGVQGINKKLPIELKINSVYKLYIGETDGVLTSPKVYEWVATWKGGKVNQRTKKWFFDNDKLRFGKKSYIEMNQKPSYSDLKAEIFGDTDFKGTYLPLADNVSKLGNEEYKAQGWSKNWNDILSSIKVKDGYEVNIFEHSNYIGDSLIVTKDYPNLKSIGWNDRASSIKVKKIPN